MIGPILYFRGLEGEHCLLSALLVLPESVEPPTLSAHGNTIHAEPLHQRLGAMVWRYRFRLPCQAGGSHYRLAGNCYTVHPPVPDETLRIAFTACNGRESDQPGDDDPTRNANWRQLYQEHQQSPFQLLLQGGDQLYADQVWELSSIKNWLERSRSDRRKLSFTNRMERQVDSFYFDLYCERWGKEAIAHMLGSLPTVMMWDDHDIFDGWGSYPKEDQSCAVYQGIYKIARKYFRIFQQHLGPDESPSSTSGIIPDQPGFSIGHTFGKTALLVLDMRSERTQDSVLSPTSWNQIYQWLDNNCQNCEHLFVMSSIPVVHPDFSLLESLLGIIPGQQELEDDLKDHWHSKSHKGERNRLIHRLLRYSLDENFRVTILSGDVHVAALGAVYGTDPRGGTRTMYQLTSSGVLHPPPPGIVLFALDQLSKGVEEVDVGITAELRNFPATRRKFIGARNFLSLEPDDQSRFWAHWICEGEEDTPYTEVLLPCS